jgi:hypothetical protein
MAGQNFAIAIEAGDFLVQLVVALAQLLKLGPQGGPLALGLVVFFVVHQAAAGGQNQAQGRRRAGPGPASGRPAWKFTLSHHESLTTPPAAPACYGHQY